MKNKQFLFAVLLISTLGFFSCSKEKTKAPKGLAGTYLGKWGSGTATPTNFIKFEIRSDGTMVRYNEQGQTIASGTWTLSGIEFDCTYTHTPAAGGQTHKIGGLYTDFDGEVIGTWGYSPSKANGGKIEMTRQ